MSAARSIAGLASLDDRGAFATPVEHPSRLRPGDILVKKGHIVIFRGRSCSASGGRRSARRASRIASIGYEVYEASSRCGRVCRSVYELDFFNGWWMFRPQGLYDGCGTIVLGNPNKAPRWISVAQPGAPAAGGR